MTIASEIERLQTAKTNIATSIGNKWVTVSSSAKLSDYPALIDQIQTGSEWVIGYMWWILSINGDMIYLNDSDTGRNKYGDYTCADWTWLYMIKPWELSDYSSSWHSYISTMVYCMALRKWGTSTVNAWFDLYDGGWYTSTSLEYYYMNWNTFRFYGATGEYYDTYRCKEVKFNGSSWSMSTISWDWSSPAQTGWNQNLLKTEVVGSMLSRGTFYFKWKPN